jgi:hypothetical protein
MTTTPGALGRLTPPDFDHVAKYPLSALGSDAPTNTPVVVGFGWYTNFDNPVTKQVDGETIYTVGEGNLGSLRGGHCFCLKPPTLQDSIEYWIYYNQHATGHCVGFGDARAQSLLHGIEFNATWLYNAARNAEGNHSEEEGSTVRAAMRVLKNKGAKPKGADEPSLDYSVSAYRWATSWDEVRATLGVPDDQDGVDFLNSWGKDYPHVTRLVDSAGEKLLAQEGEAAVFTER